jgi:hypothetical protein
MRNCLDLWKHILCYFDFWFLLFIELREAPVRFCLPRDSNVRMCFSCVRPLSALLTQTRSLLPACRRPYPRNSRYVNAGVHLQFYTYVFESSNPPPMLLGFVASLCRTVWHAWTDEAVKMPFESCFSVRCVSHLTNGNNLRLVPSAHCVVNIHTGEQNNKRLLLGRLGN